ncbi:roadblock/LC7 domain-containing protein [Dactylosporangium fulvum]|uniref:Roadblock/LC7 domain-containing protein n=1 Tax=Dactylosporangium fulvum TaxID=53359 RepID=A0ABY5WB04_9ACTN|nr:roadblock/LC7 domain-containing protein [Dactylosporangium fulvum]UWP87243.1 roadblock/LC7 domain-containing protein [Dactylosporangium fulvum]
MIDGLPRREGGPTGAGAAPHAAGPFGSRQDPHGAALAAVRAQLTDLRLRVPGVRGSVLAGVDGLLITHDLATGGEPHDLAALAATTFGLGRQSALVLGQSPFRDATMRSQGGYFTVYAVDTDRLMAVLGDDGLNVARLHLEARPTAQHLADLLA